MKINIKKLSETAMIPTRGSEYAAGYDLYADENIYIDSGQVEKIHTNIAFEIPSGYFGAIYARSGLATKHGLRPSNCVGIVDEDYRGNVIVPLYNDSSFARIIEKGERIAQLIIQPYLSVEFAEVEELSCTERGTGGFGSSGK